MNYWQVLGSKDVFAVDGRFTISVQRIKLPDGEIIDDYYQIHLPEAVITVTRTSENKIVMSRQYLHGFGRVSIVLPAGTIEKGETPQIAAKRELLEETGFSSEYWHPLTSLVPHTNYGCGKVHFFFADKAKKIAEPNYRDLENMETILLDEKEIINAIRKGDIISVGTITALSLAKIILNNKDIC